MIEVEKIVDFQHIEGRVRDVPLLDSDPGQEIYPYQNASITLREISYTDILPTTLYALRQNIQIQEQLSQALAAIGHHPLELEGGLELAAADGTKIGLLPPIVEEAPEGLCLIDGIHRNYQPRLLGRTSFMALCIENVDENYPVYAFPNAWEDIKLYDEVPSEPRLKKHYRVENPYGLYRDFSGLATSAPRK